jgi:hypothetical protein
MGDISEHFFSDGRQQDTDEDGKPLGGEPFNPNDPGAEDLPHRLSGQPTVPDSAGAPARAESSRYVEMGGGYYAHSSGVHTGEATAKACGVDLSQFEDQGID